MAGLKAAAGLPLADVEAAAGHGIGQSKYLGPKSPGFLLAALKAAADLPLADVEVAAGHGVGVLLAAGDGEIVEEDALEEPGSTLLRLQLSQTLLLLLTVLCLRLLSQIWSFRKRIKLLSRLCLYKGVTILLPDWV